MVSPIIQERTGEEEEAELTKTKKHAESKPIKKLGRSLRTWRIIKGGQYYEIRW